MYGTHKLTTEDLLRDFDTLALDKARKIAHEIREEKTSANRTDYYMVVRRQGDDVIIAAVCLLKNIDGSFDMVPDYGCHHPVCKLRGVSAQLHVKDYLQAMLLRATRYIGEDET